MKKILPVLIAFTLFPVLTIAQSLSLSLNQADYSNDTLYITGTTQDALLEAFMSVTNLTDKEIDVHAKKTELVIIENTENTFCWGACYPPFIFETSESVSIPANGTDNNSFIGDYTPDGNEGTSILRYTFYVAGNPADSVSLVVFYQVGAAGVFDWTQEKYFFNAYPNPTNGILNVEFPGVVNQVISIKVFSITGLTVFDRQTQFGESRTQIDLSSQPRGYYFLEIRDQFGHAARKKILKEK